MMNRLYMEICMKDILVNVNYWNNVSNIPNKNFVEIIDNENNVYNLEYIVTNRNIFYGKLSSIYDLKYSEFIELLILNNYKELIIINDIEKIVIKKFINLNYDVIPGYNSFYIKTNEDIELNLDNVVYKTNEIVKSELLS